MATVARRHGDDYEANRCAERGCWWAREINVVTIADDYDAMTSHGPERAYKAANLTPAEAASLLQKGVERGRYEPRMTDIFIADVLRLHS
jgi:response regulator RpfG family c-di-GMP phosphodiesterase